MAADGMRAGEEAMQSASSMQKMVDPYQEAQKRKAMRNEAVRRADMLFGRSGEKRVVVQHVDGYYWRCQTCGWLGDGLATAQAAYEEGARHFEEMHPDSGAVNVERLDVDRDQ